MTVSMSIALLIFRVVIGLTLAGHGAQKLFGWFGGPGPVRLRQGFEKQGYQAGWFWVSLAILGELGGGLSFALGFLTPLGAAGILGAMVMAARTHWKNGFFAQKGGYEYPLTLAIASITIGLIGPGNYALDALFGIALPVVPLFGVLAVAALLVDSIGIIISSRNVVVAQSESASRAS
ncbi:MAG TPA: DoxX family protein [Ktedonobacteraceae bacterium]